MIATVLMLPLLTAMADFSGLIGGFIVSSFTLRLGAVAFWTRAIKILDFSALMQGLSKPLIFGFILSTVGCYQGLRVRGGTQGVGRATTQAVVASSVFILVANFFLTKVMLFLAGQRNPHLTKPVSVYTHRAIAQATAETTRSPFFQ